MFLSKLPLAASWRQVWERSVACFYAQHMSTASSSAASTPSVIINLSKLRDNEGAINKKIRVGRGDGGRRGNYCGRGLNGHNSRSGGGAHMLYDGGQLGLLKFPLVRERPSYEVMYTQLGLSKLLEYVQAGLLPQGRVITMKDLQDSGCVSKVKYGVMLYGKMPVHLPLHLQVSACDPGTRECIEKGGGDVTRVYYEYPDGLRGIMNPSSYKRMSLPLPLPAHSLYPDKLDKS